MGRRLYYLTDNIDTVDSIAEALHGAGITDWNFHVLSKDEAGLYKHRVHSANPLQAHDVLRYGERGALFGVLAGVAIAGLVIGPLDYFQNAPVIAFIVITVLVAMHGAWTGGMAGLAQDHYRVKRFHHDIEAGRYLLMIDTDRAHRERVKEILRHFPAQPQGEHSTLVTPFNVGHA
jgi:hypothetical protein